MKFSLINEYRSKHFLLIFSNATSHTAQILSRFCQLWLGNKFSGIVANFSIPPSRFVCYTTILQSTNMHRYTIDTNDFFFFFFASQTIIMGIVSLCIIFYDKHPVCCKNIEKGTLLKGGVQNIVYFSVRKKKLLSNESQCNIFNCSKILNISNDCKVAHRKIKKH